MVIDLAFDVETIFQIAGIGIVISMIHTILKQIGKEDVAHWVTLVGFIIILFMVASYVNDLFEEVRRVFLFR